MTIDEFYANLHIDNQDRDAESGITLNDTDIVDFGMVPRPQMMTWKRPKFLQVQTIVDLDLPNSIEPNEAKSLSPRPLIGHGIILSFKLQELKRSHSKF